MKGYPQLIGRTNQIEPVPRRIRAELGGRVVLDTTSALYVWEWPHYPQFTFPSPTSIPTCWSTRTTRRS